MTSPFEFQTTGSFHLSDDGLSDGSNFEHLSPEHIAQVSEEQPLLARETDARLRNSQVDR
jgi:hypothetical protein